MNSTQDNLSIFHPNTPIQEITKCFTLILSSILLILAMAIFNVLQLLSAPLILISRPLFFALNSYVAGSLWLLCQHMFEEQNDVKIKVTGPEAFPKGESALVISNHRSFLDFCMVHSVSMRCNMIGNCRYFSKDSVKYIPFFGWGMYLAGFIFLKRTWANDANAINATFNTLIKNRLPIHLVSYLEGTRFSHEKASESHEFARKNNLPIFQHTLLPRTKGFTASVQGLRGSHIDHVYDLTIAYYHYKRGFGATPSLNDFLFGRLNEYQFRVHADRYQMDQVPEGKDEIAKW